MLIGTELNSRFVIEREIGKGGMAKIYLARDKELNRAVAIKVLNEEFSNNSEFITKMKKEAKMIAQINHENIVKVYDCGYHDRKFFIAMEHIAGGTLGDYFLTRKTPLHHLEIMNFALQIAQALHAAHKKSIVHCDIKPHNILLTEDLRVKVTDFGIANVLYKKCTHSRSKEGHILASFFYSSPEQALGKNFDERADIYSLGTIIYEALAGKTPFYSVPIEEVIRLHKNAAPIKPLRKINPFVPVHTEKIVTKALARDMNARFRDAREMIDALASSIELCQLSLVDYLKPRVLGLWFRKKIKETKFWRITTQLFSYAVVIFGFIGLIGLGALLVFELYSRIKLMLN